MEGKTHGHREREGLPEGCPDADWLASEEEGAEAEVGSTAAVADAETELDSTEVASDVGAGASVAAPAEIAIAESVPTASETGSELNPITEEEEELEADAMMDVDSLEPIAAATAGSAVVDEAEAVLAASLAEVDA